ncbi:torsin-1A-interacting protein 1-like isoform X2 [Hyperolius riggenbachi]|uniref:torsin-1A-interacting protein 1-like isoform X2 n=1 Tax=Hyperolius riggenbachi TaxID=752182 RepID=UPI0035A3A334
METRQSRARAAEAVPAATGKISSQTHDYSRTDDDETIDDGSLIRPPLRRSSAKDSKTTRATLNISISKMQHVGNTDLEESPTKGSPKAKGPGSKKGKPNVNRPGGPSAVPQNRKAYKRNDHGDSASESDDEEEDSEEQEQPPAVDFNRSSSTVTEKIRSSKTIYSSKIDEAQPRQRAKKDLEKQSWGDVNTSSFSGDTSYLQKQIWEDEKKSSFSSGTSNNQKRQRAQNKSAYSDGKVEDPSKSHDGRGTLLSLFVGLLFGALLFRFWPLILETLSATEAADKSQVVNAFQDRFRKLPVLFPGQSQNLWLRSKRMLDIHLKNGKENKEPAIILLTAAQDARHTLQCVGNQLAKTYASSFNSSYVVVSGSGKSSEDSEDVKMEIDNKLSGGFQANKKAAVLHQIESLPPGSLLILYKYCDHENAAYKNVALVLTVLLENSTLASDTALGELEEMVYDFLKEKFISSKSRTSHSEMDADKLGGVWSRISHVVLPVVPEKDNVKECREPETSP